MNTPKRETPFREPARLGNRGRYRASERLHAARFGGRDLNAGDFASILRIASRSRTG